MVKRLENNGAPPLRVYFKEWREAAGLNQKQLADKFGVAPGTISRIERGERDFTGKFLATFVQIVGCPSPGDPISRPPDQFSVDAELMRAPDEVRDYLVNRAAEISTLFDRVRPKR